MAYYNGNYPATYNQLYQQPQFYQQPASFPPFQQQNGGIIFVQGEAAAKSYPLAPGQRVLLMDSEAYRFYIKAVDANGVPLPLQTFDYTEAGAKSAATEEKKEESIDLSEYVKRDEFEALKQIVVTKKPKRRPEEDEDYA